jgi:hypothetical protein
VETIEWKGGCVGPDFTTRLRVTKCFISSCSSASVHSLPCGPRIAEEKESGFPAPSRLKSAGAGEYTGGAVVGAEAEERRA